MAIRIRPPVLEGIQQEDRQRWATVEWMQVGA
jgi:hypothetical protein